jgi:hypothetical protein
MKQAANRALVCSSTLKIERTCSSETSVDLHRTTRLHITDDRTLQTQLYISVFPPWNGGSIFLWKVYIHLQDYTESQPRRLQWEFCISIPFTETDYENVKLICLGQDMAEWRALLNAAMDIRVSQEAQTSLICWAIILSQTNLKLRHYQTVTSSLESY